MINSKFSIIYIQKNILFKKKYMYRYATIPQKWPIFIINSSILPDIYDRMANIYDEMADIYDKMANILFSKLLRIHQKYTVGAIKRAITLQATL